MSLALLGEVGDVWGSGQGKLAPLKSDFFFFFFWPCHIASGSVPRPGIKPASPALEDWKCEVLNHGTTREVLGAKLNAGSKEGPGGARMWP